jgi:Tol biopolymer transport system component
MAKKINGIWQPEIQVLPQGINTEGRETTPFVSPDGQFLFFASDGHLGMGGYDIFYCKREKQGWSAPKNLGAVVNSTLDDTHLQISADGQKVIWASVSEIDFLFSYNLFEAPIGILQTTEK